VAFEKDLEFVFSNDLKVRGQCEEAYSKASQMLRLINRTVVLEGSRVMGRWLILLVNYAVIGNGSNTRWSYKSFYKEQTTLFDILI